MHFWPPPGNLPSPRPHALPLNQSQAGWPPPATWARFHHSPRSVQSAAFSGCSSSPACAVGGHIGALAHIGESGAGPRPVLLLCSSAVRTGDVGGGAVAVAPGNGGGRRRRRRDSAGGWWVWGPGSLRIWSVTCLPPPGPREATALKDRREWTGAQLDVRVLDWFRGAAGSPECGPWRESGPGEEGGAFNLSETRGRVWKGAGLSRYAARAPSLLWGLGWGRILGAAESSFCRQD